MDHLSSLSFAAAMVVAGTAIGAPDPLAAHQWRHRVLLVVAPDIDDARLATQRQIFAILGAEAQERDLRLVEVVGDTQDARALRRRFGLGPGFHALLVGKDGGVKLSGTAPLRPEAMLPLIDAMPMRREEMKRGS